MHFNTKDISNQRFGRLIAIKPIDTDKQGTHWLCRCDCGIEKAIDGRGLRSGNTASCGCLAKEVASKRAKAQIGNDNGNFKHGKWTLPEYSVWIGMRMRCFNKNDKSYSYYGERGITICKRWSEFKYFILDMGQRPSDKHSIDRIDNDGNYEPNNCRWATHTEQMNNTRRSRKYKEG